jgi:hypothetical protein
MRHQARIGAADEQRGRVLAVLGERAELAVLARKEAALEAAQAGDQVVRHGCSGRRTRRAGKKSLVTTFGL